VSDDEALALLSSGETTGNLLRTNSRRNSSNSLHSSLSLLIGPLKNANSKNVAFHQTRK